MKKQQAAIIKEQVRFEKIIPVAETSLVSFSFIFFII